MAKKKKKKTALAAALEKIANKKQAEKAAKNKKANTQKKQAVQKKPEKKNTITEAKKAVQKGQQKSALGTKIEKKTETAKIKDDKGKTKKVKYSYENMTMQDYTKMATGTQQGRLKETLNSDKKLKKKVTDLNVKDYAKSPGVMGALDQMTQGLSVSEDPTYKYSKAQKEIINAQKKTGKYNVGRFAGAAVEFGLGGTGTVGSAIAKTGGKAVLKEAGKQGGKKLAKQTAKNVAKETAGDVVASAGLNTLDALKFSYKDGEFDKKTFAKELALNVGGDIVLGGAVSGITHGLSAKQVANFNRISKKKAKGEAISEAEQKFYDKNLDDVTNKVQDRLRQLKEEEAKNKQQATKPSDTVDNSVENKPVNHESTISKTEIVEPTKAETQNVLNNSNQELKTQKTAWETPNAVLKDQNQEIKTESIEQPKVEQPVEQTAPQTAKAPDAATPDKTYTKPDEKIRRKNPTPEEFNERVQKADRGSEISDAYENIKDAYFTTDELKEMAAQNEAEGMFNRVGGVSQAEARQAAETELTQKGIDRMAEDFVNEELPVDGHVTAAKAEVILREMTAAFENGAVNADLYYQVIEKAAIEFASTAGRNLNAVKMMYRATPEGRVRVAQKQIKALSDEYASRLKGKTLELSDEQMAMIRKAKTEDEVAEVMRKINLEMWSQIPSSAIEKFNMVRRINMLFNIKTNARNLGGNMVFRSARAISDYIEYQLTSKVVKGALEKRGVESVMDTNVTREELSNARDYIYKEVFEPNYKSSHSKNKYAEVRRPDGSTVLTSKVGSTLEKGTFKLLEKGDIYPAFRPAYTKSYLRWCKHNGIDISNIDALKGMSAKDKALANGYAMKEAEKATFRDTSKVANKLSELKHKTETGQGKTVAGTVGLRVGNMALESVLPFVKTPINVFRRSIDYSPISLLRAGSDLATFKVRGDTDALLNGIHHLATGLTGAGVTLLGWWLANQDLVMVKAGEKSGDAFYDRDMGYQDYSLVIGDKSITIDWASPMQTSFFMGAQIRNMVESFEDKDVTGVDALNTFLTLFEPHLEASFMSSAKDMLEMFAETAIGDQSGKNNWGEAILTTLGGTIPQNFLNSFLAPQLMSQSAQALDKYQRDNRSTKENPLEKSWDSWGKKVINRFPVLRNEILNPKLDRRGRKVETQGDNILTRMIHAYANPSNVKTITFDKLDKEIIKIYNDMEEGKEKDYYYYKFTGNPDYDLGNGKRMTYDEAHKYGKESRQQQTNMLKDMIESTRYKSMTNDMKFKEITASHDIGNVYADRKTYGDKFAADRIAEASVTDAEARNKLKKLGGNDKSFVAFHIKKEKLIAQSHDSSYQTKAIAAYKHGDKLVSKAFGIWGDKLETAGKYFKAGGSTKEYINSMCEVISKISKEEVTDSLANKAVAAAYSNVNERTYRAMGISEQKANMGAGLKKHGYTFEALATMEAEALVSFDADSNNSLKKEEIVSYIESLGLDSNEKKACIFAYFSDANNPYGSIPNYLEFGETDSSGGSGRGSGGKGKKGSIPSWEDYVKDYFTETEAKKTEQPKVEAYVNPVSWEDYVKNYIN